MSERRRVFVTGGSRGIGIAVVQTLLAAGYDVVAVSRGCTDGLRILKKSADGRLSIVRADLGTDSGCQEIAYRLRTAKDLYALVNNAATAVTGLHVVTPRSELVRLWRLNVHAPLLLCQAAVKAMYSARTGRIVNVSSIAAHRTFRGLAAYTATKSAVEGFSRVLAAEVGAWGINVNCVAPGYVETQMTAGTPAAVKERIMSRNVLGRQTEAADVASMIGYLLSPAARAITGQVICVDSGDAS